MTSRRPIVLVGGGTGGHIFPLVALAEELSTRHIPFIFVGEKHGREEEIVQEYRWPFRGIRAGKWRRYLTLQTVAQNIVSIGRSISGFFQAMHILGRTGSSTVFSKGGYVALPVVLAAKLMGRRVVIHESDSVMGLTNRLSSRLADRVLTAFAPKVFDFSDQRFIQVGIPIRKVLRQAARLKAPQKNRPLIMVVGGIQGSSAINKLVRESLDSLLVVADIVHITGEAEIVAHRQLAAKLARQHPGAYKPFAYISRELPYYYQSADLIVGRSGSTTVAEAALFGKAMYLIPLPTSAGNHQVVNARYLQAAGAAVMDEEHTLSPDRFSKNIQGLLADKAQLKNLGSRLREYFNEGDAVERVIDVLTNQKSSHG